MLHQQYEALNFCTPCIISLPQTTCWLHNYVLLDNAIVKSKCIVLNTGLCPELSIVRQIWLDFFGIFVLNFIVNLEFLCTVFSFCMFSAKQSPLEKSEVKVNVTLWTLHFFYSAWCKYHYKYSADIDLHLFDFADVAEQKVCVCRTVFTVCFV